MTRSLAGAGAMLATAMVVVSCSGDPGTAQPEPLVQPGHPLVGTYDAAVSYTQFTTAGPRVYTVAASITATVVIPDSVTFDATDSSYTFRGVRMTGVFCQSPGCASAARAWNGTALLTKADAFSLTLLADLPSPTLFLTGTRSGTAASGTSRYMCCSDYRDQYDGTFQLTRK